MSGEQDEGSCQKTSEGCPKVRSSLHVHPCLSCFGAILTSISEDFKIRHHIRPVASMHNQFLNTKLCAYGTESIRRTTLR